MRKEILIVEISPLTGGLLRIHKVITRGLKISIRKCDEYIERKGIPPSEIEGFTRYISTLKWVIHSHHLSEDEIAFPVFKGHLKAPYNRLKDDHEIIVSLLEKVDKCLQELQSNGVGNLRDVLQELYNIWESHIKIEEENFSDEKLREVIGLEEQEKLAEKIAEHGRKNSGPGPLTLPFVLYNLESRDRQAIMTSLPWVVRKVLVPVVWRRQWKPMKPFLLYN
jgi:hemerythrin-like domain-containing protein